MTSRHKSVERWKVHRGLFGRWCVLWASYARSHIKRRKWISRVILVAMAKSKPSRCKPWLCIILPRSSTFRVSENLPQSLLALARHGRTSTYLDLQSSSNLCFFRDIVISSDANPTKEHHQRISASPSAISQAELWRSAWRYSGEISASVWSPFRVAEADSGALRIWSLSKSPTIGAVKKHLALRTGHPLAAEDWTGGCDGRATSVRGHSSEFLLGILSSRSCSRGTVYELHLSVLFASLIYVVPMYSHARVALGMFHSRWAN